MLTRSYRHMSAEERETVSLGLARGYSLRTMATVLGRAPSTVSRESARTTTRGRPYRFCTAQIQAVARARQPRRLWKLLAPWLWQYVRTPLAEGCSPEQIAGRLQRAYPNDMGKQLSAETLYAGLVRVAPRHPAERTAGRPASGAQGTPTSGAGGGSTGPDPKYDADCRAPRRSGHSHGAGSLGRRPHQGGPQWVGRRHPGGADHTPGHSGQNDRNGCAECPRGLHEETPAYARAAA